MVYVTVADDVPVTTQFLSIIFFVKFPEIVLPSEDIVIVTPEDEDHLAGHNDLYSTR